jgi:hypothetical protein
MNDDDIIIDDRVISLDMQDALEQLLESQNFPWFLCEHKTRTSSREEQNQYKHISNNIHEHTQFVHDFVINGRANSKLLDLPVQLLQRVSDKYNCNFELARVKANFCPMVTVDNDLAHQIPHVDHVREHWVMIYYVNNSDGDTFLFENQNLSIKQRISPKKGRCLLFKGNTLHAGMHPRLTNYRMVINFNFYKL